ncbi:YihY/virulence factor BrkB family protein [Actinomadura flavalba]|uniref:YihY/virulence factor BrkB family protein n=1 Tax=Actinomadura flavalba TaxID=1120938 RepID=UPI0003644FD7|nr:YihY/virulence factor BrkB family protein [Actinomadura flavalba]
MPQVIDKTRDKAQSMTQSAKDLLARVRARFGPVDHLFRSYTRYQDKRGDRLAAALTNYGFLSFFPILALAYALLGYLVFVSQSARDLFLDAINSLLPGLADQIQVEQIAQSRTAAGLIGLAGLLFTGLGWVQVLRESLREMWGNPPKPERNFVVNKLIDAGVLLYLGVMLMLSVAVSALAGTATHAALSFVGLDHVTGLGTLLRGLSLAVAIFFDTLIFLMFFARLSGTRASWRSILRGALFGAIGFEILKQIASLLLAGTTANPVYAGFAVLIGLVVWINFVSRYILYAAAWTSTRTEVLRADTDRPVPPETAQAVSALPAEPQPQDDTKPATAGS